MKKWVATLAALGLSSVVGGVYASPKSDLEAFQNYFKKQFPSVEYQDFANGVYAIDAPSREQWMEIEEFPPYEMQVDEGEKIYKAKFKNGKTLADCFRDGPTSFTNYPYFDKSRGEVMTLEIAINECRVMNDEDPWKYGKGKIASVMGYMAYQSRGKPIKVSVSGKEATEAYNAGKQFYYARRGQLSMACAHCHVDNAGKRIRADVLSTGLGHPTHFPVYRSNDNELTTLQNRFKGCNEQVRAKAFQVQSREYRNLEYFLTYMSNGLQWNGPGARK